VELQSTGVCTQLVLAGADLITAKELLGDADIKTPMRYAHPTSGSKRRAVEMHQFS